MADAVVDRLIGTMQLYPLLTTGHQKVASLSTTTQHAIVQDLILFSVMSRLISEPERRLTCITYASSFVTFFDWVKNVLLWRLRESDKEVGPGKHGKNDLRINSSDAVDHSK